MALKNEKVSPEVNNIEISNFFCYHIIPQTSVVRTTEATLSDSLGQGYKPFWPIILSGLRKNKVTGVAANRRENGAYNT